MQNKEAPITCKIRINQPLFILTIIDIIESKAIVKNIERKGKERIN